MLFSTGTEYGPRPGEGCGWHRTYRSTSYRLEWRRLIQRSPGLGIVVFKTNTVYSTWSEFLYGGNSDPGSELVGMMDASYTAVILIRRNVT
jgi:hypothetical protein